MVDEKVVSDVCVVYDFVGAVFLLEKTLDRSCGNSRETLAKNSRQSKAKINAAVFPPQKAKGETETKQHKSQYHYEALAFRCRIDHTRFHWQWLTRTVLPQLAFANKRRSPKFRHQQPTRKTSCPHATQPTTAIWKRAKVHPMLARGVSITLQRSRKVPTNRHKEIPPNQFSTRL